LAFLLDFLDDTVKSIDDVDRYIHLPALALIPANRGDRPLLRGSAPLPAGSGNGRYGLAMMDDVRSPIAESYRHLRNVSAALFSRPASQNDPCDFKPAFRRQDDHGGQHCFHAGPRQALTC